MGRRSRPKGTADARTTAAESRPPTLDELLDALGKEWAAGVERLNEFEHLFGKAEHVELLNFVGGAFFREVQWVLLDDLQLCISRLTDPPKSGKGKNLTVKRLPEFCKCDTLRKEVEAHVVEACKAAGKSARQHRNERISHTDLAYAIGDSELPSIVLKQIRVSLDAVGAALQTVSRELRDVDMMDPVPRPGVEVFLSRIARLVDAVLCVEELLADLNGQKPPWDQGVARDCIRRLEGTPSDENVQRIVSLRKAAGWLRKAGIQGTGTRPPRPR